MITIPYHNNIDNCRLADKRYIWVNKALQRKKKSPDKDRITIILSGEK